MSKAEVVDTIIQGVLAPGARAHVSARAGELLGSLPRGGLVLDIGCGFSSPMFQSRLCPMGVDIDWQRAKAHARRAPAIAADARALPFADARFAGVASLGLLHHLDDKGAQRAIAEMTRVTRPGGLIAVFDGIWPGSFLKRPLAAAIRALDFGGHMRSEAQLRALFADDPGWRSERVLYARTGLEGLWFIRQKSDGV